ncbi:hypothetical protein ACFYYI_17475 [Streptomyces sp. NPDC002387]|uniref:hypothetical protein n=1 Tax=unclassified Streptomyces TaxID=2593676 RepID=UPI0036A8E4AB
MSGQGLPWDEDDCRHAGQIPAIVPRLTTSVSVLFAPLTTSAGIGPLMRGT